MTYRFECRCGKKLEAADENLGEEVRCTGCGARILLPFKPDGEHGYAAKEKLARPALVLGLLPFIMIAYVAIERAITGPGQSTEAPAGAGSTIFNLLGIVLWLGQAVTLVLALVALRRIKRADESGSFLEGEKEATAALVLGVIWLALFVRFMLAYFTGF